MEKSEMRILFMDDEMGAAREAVEALEREGCKVTKRQKISEVLESYCQEFYHLYILDIDMARIEDTIDERGDQGESIDKQIERLWERLELRQELRQLL